MVVFQSVRGGPGGEPVHIWVHQEHIVMVGRSGEGTEVTLSTGEHIVVRDDPRAVADAVASGSSSATRSTAD
jgi:hypothetical protein